MSSTQNSHRAIVISAIVIATILKLYCAATTFGTNDTGLFQLYGHALYEAGLEETYKASEHFNHTPALSSVLMALYWLSLKFGWSFPLLLRLPGIAADIVSSLVLWRLLSRHLSIERAAVWACLFALNPVSFMVSGYHGNFDSVISMFILLATYSAFRERVDLCALFFALSVHVKIAPLILSPVFFFFWLRRGKGARFFGLTTAILLAVWIFPLAQYPVLFLHNVFGYGSYWEIWGITYWLRETGYPPFYLVSFYGLSPIQNHIMTVLKIVVVTGIILLSWKRSHLDRHCIFGTVSGSFAIFFVFAPGVLLHYLAWPLGTMLPFARRWWLVILTASSIFLFRCYTVINGGLPWDKGLFTVHVLDQWIAWSNIPWVIYICFLAYFLKKDGYAYLCGAANYPAAQA